MASHSLQTFAQNEAAFPSAMPAMKLERIKAADQIELPKVKPLRPSQSVSKISEPIPERKRTLDRIATRPAEDQLLRD